METLQMNEQKVVIVTGGARGIGAATSKRFKREGWHTVAFDEGGAGRPLTGEHGILTL